MQPALHLKTKVLPEKSKAKKRSILELIEESRSKNTLRSAEDIDRQLREERDSWDS
jgi:uncharacterized protein YeeX (DUF496 family)